MIIPLSSKEIIESLKNKYEYSNKKIMNDSKFSRRPLHRILNEEQISFEMQLRLLSLYIKAKQFLKI